MLRSARQETHRDRGGDADFALQVERAAVQFDEGLGQRQAETCALVLAVQITVDLAESALGMSSGAMPMPVLTIWNT